MRHALIDPWRRCLGWDTEDPAQAVPEYRVPSGQGRAADYAMFARTARGKRTVPDVIVEARKLSGESHAPVQGMATGSVPVGDALRQPPSKATPMIVTAMRSHDDDWVPLSVIGSHLHVANPEFDLRTYGCAKRTDVLEKTGRFEAGRDAVPVVARVNRVG